MKFAGYGIVWNEKKNKPLVEFENSLDRPGVVDIEDQATIDEMLRLGYEEFTGSLEPASEVGPKKTKKKGAKNDSNQDGN